MIWFGGKYRYNNDMVTFNAHYDGKAIVPDEPSVLPFRSGARLRIQVEAIEPPPVTPTPVSGRTHLFQPLDLRIDPELAKAIGQDPEFNIENS